MGHGLLWLPLLAMFIVLARLGWHEYRKIEAYREWAQGFERSKYDILAVLGQRETTLTWGTPTRSGPIGLKSLSLATIDGVEVQVDQTAIDIGDPPQRGKTITLVLTSQDQSSSYAIPFTEIPLAVEWCYFLREYIGQLAIK
ncbi:hypothetical protein L3556_15320 [Candidatus Synechococcus calcipolaris G9]|uniref:Transmembrane protein n=1 Tax=Candidatus Synechococcus calcipolaris G9 TaxID=1497997 RepID=A0ABT6F366_9SYNE|nr:hypothetical protein [Candidatus Synechococcus calcipolaris]MDG2992288.1 hypothetical protein [Candidatus Synechococcus calcipolaris G9]